MKRNLNIHLAPSYMEQMRMVRLIVQELRPELQRVTYEHCVQWLLDTVKVRQLYAEILRHKNEAHEEAAQQDDSKLSTAAQE